MSEERVGTYALDDLIQALRRFGGHRATCEFWNAKGGDKAICTCGWRELERWL